MNLKKIALIAAISIAPLAAHASGFTGSYAGVQIGQVSGQDYGVEYIGGSPDGYAQSTKAKGIAMGALGGYNWAINDKMLWGVDGDLRLGSVSGNSIQYGPGFPAGWAISTKVKDVLAIRAKFGYEFNDKTMAYVAAGLANAKIERSFSTYPSSSERKTGLTFGLGAEQSITDKISLRLEYRYTYYGSSDVASGSGVEVEKQKYKEQSLLFGAAYHF
jgi:outer membrane immunogenic protein